MSARPVGAETALDSQSRRADWLAPETIVRAVVEAALRLDSPAVERALTAAIAAYPLDVFCLDVVAPSLVEIGELWHRGEITPALEHFATEILRRRVDQIAALLDAGTARPLVIVGAAPGELHDVGALILTVLLRQRGLNVAFLGADVPAAALLDMAQRFKPDAVCLSASTAQTAAAIPPVAAALQALQAPAPLVAFGGRAFVTEPYLVGSTPGTYLGASTREAVATIERQLRMR